MSISSDETGYEVCLSSDLTELTRTTTETMPPSPLTGVVSATASARLSNASSEYVTASQSSAAHEVGQPLSVSVSSFEFLPTIPSLQEGSVSSHRTASSPSDFSSTPVYFTNGEVDLEEIPFESQLSLVLSPLTFPARTELNVRSAVYEPSADSSIRYPSTVSTLPEVLSSSSSAGIPAHQSLSSLSPLSLLALSPLSFYSQHQSLRSPPSASVPVTPQLQPSLTLISPSSPPSNRRSVPVTPPHPHPQPSLFTSISPSSPSTFNRRSVPVTPQPHPLLITPLSPSSPSKQSVPAATSPDKPLPPLPSSCSSLPIPPSALSPLQEGRQDVALPNSLRILTPTGSSLLDEESVVIPSPPSSTSEFMSVMTPTSLAIAPVSTKPTPPPSRPSVLAESTVSSPFSMTTAISPTELTQSSSSAPPNFQPWASVTDFSYESSILQPSPSIVSIELQEGIETSFETSFLRPSYSLTSVRRSTPLPALSLVSPSYSPVPSLTPVLSPSVSSSSDVRTPSSVESLLESPVGQPLPYQPKISYESSLLESENEDEVQKVHPMLWSSSTESSLSSGVPSAPDQTRKVHLMRVSSPSSEPSLSSSVQALPDHAHSLGPPETPPPPTTQGSLILSITTPHGNGATERSSLRTLPSITAAPERVVQEFDALIDDVQTYDRTRSLEYEELANEVKSTQDEVRGLREFVRGTYSAAGRVVHRRTTLPVIHMTRPTSRRRAALVDRSVGGSSVLSSIFPSEFRSVDVIPNQAASLGQSQSKISLQSYLSSHHSDDDTLEAAAAAEVTLPFFPVRVNIESSPDTSSSSTSTTSSSRSSDLTSSVLASSSDVKASSMFQQLPESLDQTLQELREQIRTLGGSQAANYKILEEVFERRRDDRAGELTERLERIEGLIQTYIDQGHPRGPEIIHQPLRSQTASITNSTNSRLRYLRSILTSPEVETRPPISSRTEPAVAQQLDETLSAQISPAGVHEVPRIEHFVYRPNGARARSASPTSVERLPPAKTQAEPLFLPIPTQRSRRPTRPRRKKVPKESSESEATRPRTPDVERLLNERRIFRDARRQPPPQEAFNVGPGPTPLSVLPSSLYDRAASVMRRTVRKDERPRPTSWYIKGEERPKKPKQLASTTPARIPPPHPAGHADGHYLPMPSGRTVAELPSLEPPIEVLRENRLAQLATVDQQRELMRYLRGLNEWLELDVHNRQSEIKGIYTTVDQISRDIHEMQTRGRRSTAPSRRSSTRRSETNIRLDLPAGPAPRPTHRASVPPASQFVSVEQRPAVIPSVIPEHRTLPLPFPPVVPQPRSQRPVTSYLQPPVVMLPAGYRTIPTSTRGGRMNVPPLQPVPPPLQPVLQPPQRQPTIILLPVVQPFYRQPQRPERRISSRRNTTL